MLYVALRGDTEYEILQVDEWRVTLNGVGMPRGMFEVKDCNTTAIHGSGEMPSRTVSVASKFSAVHLEANMLLPTIVVQREGTGVP